MYTNIKHSTGGICFTPQHFIEKNYLPPDNNFNREGDFFSIKLYAAEHKKRTIATDATEISISSRGLSVDPDKR